MEMPSSVTGQERSRRDLLLWLAAGLITGLAGVLFFGIAHHILIVPIWDRLGEGIPFALGGGAAMGWLYYELKTAGRITSRLRDAVLFGVLLWINLIPMTLIASGLRLAGIRSRMGDWDTVSDVTIAFLTTAFACWLWTRSRRLSIVMGLVMIAIVLVMAGPIAIVNSRRAAYLFLAFLIVYPISGILLVLVRSWLGTLRLRWTTRPAPDQS